MEYKKPVRFLALSRDVSVAETYQSGYAPRSGLEVKKLRPCFCFANPFLKRHIIFERSPSGEMDTKFFSHENGPKCSEKVGLHLPENRCFSKKVLHFLRGALDLAFP